MPHEVPLIVNSPELEVTLEFSMNMPLAEFVPSAAVPVIVTLPEPVDETFAVL